MKIETLRTQLRRIELSDFSNMRLLETNPEIMRFIPSAVPQTEEQTLKRLKDQVAQTAEKEPFGIWVAELKETSEFFGWFMLAAKTTDELVLGYMSVQKHWNKGLVTEVCGRLIEFAKAHSQIQKISATTSLDNYSSIKVLEKLGFVKTGEIKVFEKAHGGEIPLNAFLLELKEN